MSAPYILVVDDDDAIRDSFRELLEGDGYAVQSAWDGEEAITLLLAHQSEPPSLILLDMMMPRKNGWQVLEALHESVVLVHIPVVVVSANIDVQPAGAIAWLRKPMSAVTLLDTVKKHMKAA